MVKEKEYVVGLKVSFLTPVSAKATTETKAGIKGAADFKKHFKTTIAKLLDDYADLEIEVDYAETDDDEGD